ncbi:ER membrane protein complex subunit 2-like protein [Skeletonema marinoi]|uniref:ER membrane protein complex subunit 2 n=1 Tax=Skeletonema marinoi TaxID=267567 RepID=A0AAD9DK63_9STRA|nr:ER membrane protein complex subunit 2-like protein [Skeletonema marinoi]
MGPEEDLPTLISQKDHLNVLRYVRAHQLREPNLVVNHGKILLQSKSLGDAERLASLEQICIAACDIGDLDLAESCLDSIVNPTSNNKSLIVTKQSSRYRKLLALCLEAAGNYESAGAVYDILLQDNPSNAYAAKRKYCILAAQPDLAAWNQMAEMCLSVSDFKGAAYCYEELVLGCPLDSNIHTKLGEVYCTAGGVENAKLARKHLAQAVQLDPNNLRAWYGLVAAAEGYLEEVEKISKNKREAEDEGVEVAKELIKFGGEKLVGIYKGTKLAKVVNAVLKESSESL